MRQNPPESGLANPAVPDVGVTVQMRSESALGIIGVDDLDMVQPQVLVQRLYGVLEACCRRDVVPGGERMAGIDAESDRKIGNRSRHRSQLRQLIERTPERLSGTRGILEQQFQAARLQSESRGGNRCSHHLQRVFDRCLPLLTARMQHDELRPNRQCPLQLTAERFNRLPQYVHVGSPEVDQIVRVDRHRTQPVLLAQPLELRHAIGTRLRSPPRARTGRKDLEAIRANGESLFRRVLESAGRRSVKSGAQGLA